MTDAKKKILIVSDYDRAYQTLSICQKIIIDSELSLFTSNKDIDKIFSRFNLIMRGHFKLKNSFTILRQIYSLRKYNFDSIVIDHGFNIVSLVTILLLNIPNLFIIAPGSEKVLQPFARRRLLYLSIKNFRYLFNRFLIKLSMETKCTKVFGLPIELTIESSAICNLKCRGCPTGLKLLSRPAGLLKIDTLEDFLKKNKRYLKYLERAYPFLYGECLLNSEIFNIIKMIRRYVNESCMIILHTHGSFSNPEELAKEIIGSGIDQISISLDGPDKETYKKYRVAGDFEKVCAFIKSLVAEREARQIYSPEIIVQMIVTKFTENKIEEMKSLCKELKADRLVLKSYLYEFNLIDEDESKRLNPAKELWDPYNRTSRSIEEVKNAYIRQKNNRCGWVYKSMIINWDGSIAPCCLDSDSKLLKTGNIFNSNIKKIWNDKAYRQLRRQIYRGEINFCSKCYMS